ncbi:EamA family transporter [Marinomonas piezotolerans]|uniref:EamA family transporter n=1 Tax=Marinomonas piezotolerans TaxID=2213058 RepID=A0A370UCG5_9GAMM|nr:DMT family transporter [Marinomonas piezotolerans]RDL45431.1 EamA family transporter [Marinomonas piezotolerans]
MTSRQIFLCGLFFSSVCVMFWSMLPIALKLSSGFSDPITLTWFRFTGAGLILLIWQAARGQLAEFKTLSRKHWLTLFAAGSFLIINYSCFAWSLNYLHPGVAQLSFQVAPFFLALGGWFIFKEHVRWQQWACFAVLGLGMMLFFHPVLSGRMTSTTPYATAIGFVIVQTSVLCWSLYALLQKSLFQKLSPTNILLGIYLFALIVMLPFTHPTELLSMNRSETIVAVFCCLNTLIAYGAFAQAMKYWQTVQVSAAVAMTPAVAFILTELVVSMGLWPNLIQSAHADLLSLGGMATVVIAAIAVQLITASLNKRRFERTKSETTAA